MARKAHLKKRDGPGSEGTKQITLEELIHNLKEFPSLLQGLLVPFNPIIYSPLKFSLKFGVTEKNHKSNNNIKNGQSLKKPRLTEQMCFRSIK